MPDIFQPVQLKDWLLFFVMSLLTEYLQNKTFEHFTFNYFQTFLTILMIIFLIVKLISREPTNIESYIFEGCTIYNYISDR